MGRKSVQSSRGRAVAAPGDGFLSEIVDRVFENPAMSGGLMVVALTATAIVSNAMFLQRGHHPDPLFAPQRPAAARPLAKPAEVAPVAMPVLRPRPPEVAAAPAPVLVPLPRLSPRSQIAAPNVVPVAAPAADDNVKITASIQRELARLGLYSDRIDGRGGPRTSAAIAAYERAAGLPPTGNATAELLAELQSPVPPRGIPAAAPPSDAEARAAQAAELDRREEERAASIAAEQNARSNAIMHQNYRIVQGALNRIGYGPLQVTGQTDEATTDAIRRFELDNGLPITGEASDALITHMIAIGAIKAT